MCRVRSLQLRLLLSGEVWFNPQTLATRIPSPHSPSMPEGWERVPTHKSAVHYNERKLDCGRLARSRPEDALLDAEGKAAQDVESALEALARMAATLMCAGGDHDDEGKLVMRDMPLPVRSRASRTCICECLPYECYSACCTYPPWRPDRSTCIADVHSLDCTSRKARSAVAIHLSSVLCSCLLMPYSHSQSGSLPRRR